MHNKSLTSIVGMCEIVWAAISEPLKSQGPNLLRSTTRSQQGQKMRGGGRGAMVRRSADGEDFERGDTFVMTYQYRE